MKKILFDGRIRAYRQQNLSNEGFVYYRIQTGKMKTCRQALYIAAFEGAAGELLLQICPHEENTNSFWVH